jgi:hypothetical protein
MYTYILTNIYIYTCHLYIYTYIHEKRPTTPPPHSSQLTPTRYRSHSRHIYTQIRAPARMHARTHTYTHTSYDYILSCAAPDDNTDDDDAAFDDDGPARRL